MSGHPSYVTETRGGGRRLGDKYYGDFVVDVEREFAELRQQLAAMRSEPTPGATPGLSRVDLDLTGSVRAMSEQTGSKPDHTRAGWGVTGASGRRTWATSSRTGSRSEPTGAVPESTGSGRTQHRWNDQLRTGTPPLNQRRLVERGRHVLL